GAVDRAESRLRSRPPARPQETDRGVREPALARSVEIHLVDGLAALVEEARPVRPPARRAPRGHQGVLIACRTSERAEAGAVGGHGEDVLAGRRAESQRTELGPRSG